MTLLKLIARAESARTREELLRVEDDYRMVKPALGIGEALQVAAAIHGRYVRLLNEATVKAATVIAQAREGICQKQN